MQFVTRRQFLKNASALSVATLGGRVLDAAAQQEVLKVGVVHQYPIGEVGWEAQHAQGWKAMEAAFPGKVKATVVAGDLRERTSVGRDLGRVILNYGHTLGHAIESACGYSGLRHGEAVGYGILFALRLAQRRGLSPEAGKRIHALIRRLELPPLPRLSADELMATMARDKKARESGLVWVLPRSLGEGLMVGGISNEDVRTELEGFLGDPFRPPV